MLTKIAFSLTLSAKLLALSCSNPITLSAPDQEIINVTEVTANARGDFVVYCKLTDVEGEKIQVALKPKEGSWLPFATVVQEGDVSVKDCIIDDEGNIDLFLLKGCCGNQTLHWANKKWGEPWSRVFDFFHPKVSAKYVDPAVYKKSMIVSLAKGERKDYVDHLMFTLYDKENSRIIYKSIAKP